MIIEEKIHWKNAGTEEFWRFLTKLIWFRLNATKTIWTN